MLRHFAAKWEGCGVIGLIADFTSPPNALSPSNAVNAIAPKPPAHRESIWRRVSGAGIYRPQCMGVPYGCNSSSRCVRFRVPWPRSHYTFALDGTFRVAMSFFFGQKRHGHAEARLREVALFERGHGTRTSTRNSIDLPSPEIPARSKSAHRAPWPYPTCCRHLHRRLENWFSY